MVANTIPNYIIAIPAFISLVILIIRLFSKFEKNLVLTFLLWGIPFFWAKEVLQKNRVLFDHLYTMPKNYLFTIFGVPPIIIIGYLFTFALALFIAIRILNNLKVPANIPFLLTTFSAVVYAIAYATEQAAQSVGWWTWGNGIIPWWTDPNAQWMGFTWFIFIFLEVGSTGSVPSILMGGWQMVLFFFVGPVMYANYHRDRKGPFGPSFGYMILTPFMLLVGRAVVQKSIYHLIPYFLLIGHGLFKNGNKPIFPEISIDLKNPLLKIIQKFGDYIAAGIFLAVILYAEVSVGFNFMHFVSLLPFLYMIFLSLVPSRKILISIGILTIIVGLAVETVPDSPLWTTPFKLAFFYTLTIGVIPSLILWLHRRWYGTAQS